MNNDDIFEKCNNIIITDEMVDIESWLSENDIINLIKSLERVDKC